MLSLNYIIIGYLPEKERKYLLNNLEREQEKGKVRVALPGDERSPGRVCVQEVFPAAPSSAAENSGDGGCLWTWETLAHFPPEESLIVSGNAQELAAAQACGMAAVCYCGNESPQMQAQADMYAEGLEEAGLRFLRHVHERRHGIPWTILATERCIVREFSMEYLDALFELYAGEGMTDYLEPLYEYEEETEYQKAYIKHMYGFYGYGMWIVCDKETGRLIGRAGIEHREELGGEAELGYAIGVPYQRQGYAAEVCGAILDYAKEELGMTRLNCLVEEGNAASGRLAVKLGFRAEGGMELGGKKMERYVIDL